MQKKSQIICTIQKKAVPLHAFSLEGERRGAIV